MMNALISLIWFGNPREYRLSGRSGSTNGMPR